MKFKLKDILFFVVFKVLFMLVVGLLVFVLNSI
jgi:hypothetical protein